jgi:hypothetical protein
MLHITYVRLLNSTLHDKITLTSSVARQSLNKDTRDWKCTSGKSYRAASCSSAHCTQIAQISVAGCIIPDCQLLPASIMNGSTIFGCVTVWLSRAPWNVCRGIAISPDERSLHRYVIEPYPKVDFWKSRDNRSIFVCIQDGSEIASVSTANVSCG